MASRIIDPVVHSPTSHSYLSQRLRLHYVDWGNEEAPTLLLIHGGRDHCRNWDWVARAFHADYHVIALDLRGHGDSQWVFGSGYTMIDYVYDIAQLIHQKNLEPITIIGHSLGGSIALQYAGIYPEKVHKLISIEGLGPRQHEIKETGRKPAPQRIGEWIDQTRGFAGRVPRRYNSVEDAIARMHDANSNLSEEQARHLTIHGINQNEDGTYSWKFDNYARGHAPDHFDEDEARELWGEISCPTLLVGGGDSWSGDPTKDGRAKLFRNAEVIIVPNAGHWVHHDRLDIFLEAVHKFLSE